jgi:hypothetical protein
VRSHFDNGGSSLYVSRAFNAGATSPPGYCYAQATLPPPASLPPAQTLTWQARYPGAAGNVTLVVTFSIGQDVLGGTSPSPSVRGLNDYDIVWISPVASPPTLPGTGGTLYCAESYLNKSTGTQSWSFHDQLGNSLDLSQLDPSTQELRVLTASLQITYPDGIPRTDFYPGLTFDPRSQTSFAQTFAEQISDSYYQLTRPIVFQFNDYSSTPNADAAGIEIAQLMLAQVAPVNNNAVGIPQMIGGVTAQYTEILEGGLDGIRPLEPQYQGTEDPSNPAIKTGLVALEDVSDISIVAAPGSSFGALRGYVDAQQITNDLITHCETMLYRIAVLDSPDEAGISDISAWRGQFDSSYAAMYYPWVRILDPVTDLEANMPPSGFVCGIYARSDSEEGVQKAPANEVVNDAIGFEVMLNKGQQDLLNPQGINAFRYFPGRGYRLWGARTATSDPLWQYVNVRRYMNYLKKSIDEGTQSVVFENNGPALWASVTQLITDFLTDEFRNGRLLGTTPAEAFFVRCDLTTMTQVDLDNGRMVCLIGVALLKPAEFVIFRIGQWTASSTPQ